MKRNTVFQKPAVRNAFYIAILCSTSYLAVYFARNILSAVTPKMLSDGYSTEYIGQASSVYFISYAVGQLLNGAIGDKIRAKYMISVGLLMAGVTNLLFAILCGRYPQLAVVLYGLTGFFLSMIYGPITKVVAENTEPIYTPRCTLGYTFSSFIGTPLAGVAAAFLTWGAVFFASSLFLAAMAVCCFVVFLLLEKKGIIKYDQFHYTKEKGGSLKALLQRQIIKFTIISLLTGVVRTTVVFWMPTYITQYLGYTQETSSLIFTVTTFIISLTTFLTIFLYETVLKRDMDRTVLYMFLASTLFFTLLYFIKHPVLNVVFLTAAIMSTDGAATMLYSKYCPSLRDTGMVSGATGFLDFASYIAASVSSSLYANALEQIGWRNIILTWIALAVVGVLVSLPYRKWKNRGSSGSVAVTE